MDALLDIVGELFLPERFDVPGGTGVLPFADAVRRFTLSLDNDVDSGAGNSRMARTSAGFRWPGSPRSLRTDAMMPWYFIARAIERRLGHKPTTQIGTRASLTGTGGLCGKVDSPIR